MEKKITMFKSAFQLAAGIGAMAFANRVVSAVVPANTKILTKACIGIATFVITDMLVAKMNEYIDKSVDDTVQQFNKFVTKEVKVGG